MYSKYTNNTKTHMDPSLDRTLPRSRQRQQSILRQFMASLEKSNDRYFQQKPKQSSSRSSSSSRNRSYNQSKRDSRRNSINNSIDNIGAANMGAENAFINNNRNNNNTNSCCANTISYKFDMELTLKANVPIIKLCEPTTKTEIDIAVLCNQSKVCSLINYYVDFDSRVGPFLVP